jgi:hypothetical protein
MTGIVNERNTAIVGGWKALNWPNLLEAGGRNFFPVLEF